VNKKLQKKNEEFIVKSNTKSKSAMKTKAIYPKLVPLQNNIQQLPSQFESTLYQQNSTVQESTLNDE
jgi:hypothetical protein